MKFTYVLAAATIAAAPAFADSHASGDPEAGEAGFKKCAACHVVMDADGNTLAGKKSKTGPNLYGIVGQPLGGVEGFKYGKSIVELGESGVVWDEATFVEYTADPKKFLQTRLDDKKARSKMSFKLKKEQDALDIWAFLVSVSPEPAATN